MTTKPNRLIQTISFFAVKKKNLVVDRKFDCNATFKE